jgi:hypothetical protein
MFAEILRILRPGGRLVTADVVSETDPGPSIRNDARLQGQCISGTLTQRDLVGILEETGFRHFRVLNRFPYRVVQNHRFFSMTFEARRPRCTCSVPVIYRGPFAAATTSSGITLRPGITAELPREEAELLGDQVLRLNERGEATNVEVGGCSCSFDPDGGCC